MRLIDADALLKKLDDSIWYNVADFNEAWYAVDHAPTVEDVPVRHGRWETVEDWDGDEHYQCSECKAEYVLIDGTPSDNDYLYCPNCGARMDGDNGKTD